MNAWTKKDKTRARKKDQVLCKVALNLNAAEDPGPRASSALGGLGVVEYVGTVTPEQAAAIMLILFGPE